jgi:hypothetical protein
VRARVPGPPAWASWTAAAPRSSKALTSPRTCRWQRNTPGRGLEVQGLAFRVQGLGCKVQGGTFMGLAVSVQGLVFEG